MDSLTHLSLGAVIADLGMGSRLGRRAWVWGAILGSVPDLDVAAFPLLDGAARLTWHRGVSHSLLAVAVLAPVLGLLVRRVHRGAVGWRRATAVAALCLATHVFLDLLNVYGTQLLEPFSDARFGLDLLFVIDPLFTLPLAAGAATLLAVRRRPAVRRAAGALALLGAGLWLLLAAARKSDADARFAAGLRAAGIAPDRWLSAPAPLTTALWYAVAQTDEACWVSLWGIHDDPDRLPTFRPIPRRLFLLDGVRDSRAVRVARWASQGYDAVRLRDGVIEVCDLRFGLMELLQRDVDLDQVEAVFQHQVVDGGRDLRLRRGALSVRWGLTELWARIRGG